VLAGAALYALALPPFDWAVCGWLALVPLLLVVRDEEVPRAFAYGLLFGVACGWSFTWWACQAMAGYFHLGLPLAALAATLIYLAVSVPTFGLFAAGAGVLLRADARWKPWITVPALWVATELIRGRLVEQPWGLLGYTQHANVGLIQVATIGGVYAVSFLVVMGATAIAQAWTLLHRGATRAACAWLTLPAGLVVASLAAGSLLPPPNEADDPALRPVAVVQTNVPPSYHWTRAYTERQVVAHLQATEHLPGNPVLILWPENSVPRYLDAEPMLAVRLAEMARRRRADILFGGPRYDRGSVRNSVRLITAAGRNGGFYDKQHLVLFAEEKPLARYDTVAYDESPREFTPGASPGVLQSFVPLGVSICHEIVYPELVLASVRQGAELLVNVSNDGWLDAGSGVATKQHFAMGILRAVETRRYLVRAATTGVSGVVDPYGRVIGSLSANRAGTLVASVAGRSVLTPYARLGDVFAFLCAFLALAALAIQVSPLRLRASLTPIHAVR
jgi:apolipoprotein N-acyltransferase